MTEGTFLFVFICVSVVLNLGGFCWIMFDIAKMQIEQIEARAKLEKRLRACEAFCLQDLNVEVSDD